MKSAEWWNFEHLSKSQSGGFAFWEGGFGERTVKIVEICPSVSVASVEWVCWKKGESSPVFF
jgi:hypothetical protein